MSSISFIDISIAQSPREINASKLATYFKGAYVRCGEGLRSLDAAYVEHGKRISGAGMRLGAYHVIAPSSGDPAGQAYQAEAWMHRVSAPELAGERLPLAIDVERNSPLGKDAPKWVEFLAKYLEALDSATGVVMYCNTSFANELLKAGIVYAGPWWIAEYRQLIYPSPFSEQLRNSVLMHHQAAMSALSAGDAAKFRDELNQKNRAGMALSRLELHPTTANSIKPPAPSGAHVVAWQWGGDANASTAPGVDGLCDRNWFLGSEEEWSAFRA